MARLTEIYNCWQCEDCLFSETSQLCTKMEDRPVYDQAFGIPDWCPLPETEGWITVEERLPEEGREVLVLSRIRRIAGGGANPAVFSAHFYDGDWELPDQRGWLMGKLVTHWRRLPSLPEEATCETCGGQGWYAADNGRGEPEQAQCEACYGTGKRIAELEAEVTR